MDGHSAVPLPAAAIEQARLACADVVTGYVARNGVSHPRRRLLGSRLGAVGSSRRPVCGSESTDDIACWFIDTAYDDQQFFVRHAYFLGADDPYDKLKRALRADIDEAAWASLNSTVSRPFPRPASGRIAVKVMNHYGDEILKVYGV